VSLKASRILIFVAILLSLGLAYAFCAEYYWDIEPCQLCYIQRYLYAFAIVSCLFSAFIVERVEGIKYFALLTIVINTGFSFYHVGVEQKWWKGPESCVTKAFSLNVDSLNPDDAIEHLKKQLEGRKVVPCDQITWRILGLPATVWDTIFLSALSLITLIMCLACQRKAYNYLFRK
jgi:disulfide bond formation protein DsbB